MKRNFQRIALKLRNLLYKTVEPRDEHLLSMKISTSDDWLIKRRFHFSIVDARKNAVGNGAKATPLLDLSIHLLNLRQDHLGSGRALWILVGFVVSVSVVASQVHKWQTRTRER